MMLMLLMIMMVLMLLMVMMVLMLLMIVMMLMLLMLHLRQQLICERYRLLHRVMDRLPVQLIPRGRDNRCIRILLTNQPDRLIDLFLGCILCS